MEKIQIDFDDLHFERGMENTRKSKELLRQSRLKEITLNELLLDCAYWDMDNIYKLYPHPLPTLSEEGKKYQKMGDRDQGKAKEGRTKGYQYYCNWLEEERKIKVINYGNYLWLLHYQSVIPIEDTKNQGILAKQIAQFTARKEWIAPYYSQGE